MDAGLVPPETEEPVLPVRLGGLPRQPARRRVVERAPLRRATKRRRLAMVRQVLKEENPMELNKGGFKRNPRKHRGQAWLHPGVKN
jgi:hypothetical protein